MSANTKRGVDALLTKQARSLPVGQSFSFRLIKGPPSQSKADPVDSKAPHQVFPLVAKFPESVVKPDFTTHPWNEGRLYQQDVPKPAEDSDEEEEPKDSNIALAQPLKKKKRWKYNRPAAARQWVLQEQVDFLETMVARRENKNASAAHMTNNNTLSSRYQGVPEHNPSQYALLLVDHACATTTTPSASAFLQIQTLPSPHGTISFAQPAARKSYSLSQAEQAIQDQRMGIRTGGGNSNHNINMRAPRRRLGNNKNNSSKDRLLSKLLIKQKKDNDDNAVEEADDVMGDVTYSNRKKGGGSTTSAARRELLDSLGDGLAVSQEGVLGGTNDAAFGGRGDRFGQLAAASAATSKGEDAASKNAVHEERGADGAAMADDFYQRDVKAEYEELDYDANEQFDDDDVDLGESEVVVDAGGYGDEDEDDELEDLDVDEEEVVGGAAGLATAAGFKAMLAKARGESPVQTDVADAANAANAPGGVGAEDGDVKQAAAPAEEEADHMAKIMAAAEKAKQAASGKAAKSPAAGQSPSTAKAALQVDENGQRIISIETVRSEIWLHHNKISMKRLMKIFEVKKKSPPERQTKFREVVRELCTMKADPVEGRMLVLKQHYSNMG